MNKEREDGQDRQMPGRFYFSRQAEQKVFFYLTLAMLLAGLVYRLI